MPVLCISVFVSCGMGAAAAADNTHTRTHGSLDFVQDSPEADKQLPLSGEM